MPDVVLVTCAAFPDGDEDGPQLLDAVRATGLSAEWRAWDDASVDWQDTTAVLRATWDYTLRREQFLAWARSVPRLHNPYDAVVWNSDKTYLRELAAAGVPVTPTTWAPPGSYPELLEADELVIKPSVGAGSRGAGRFAADDPAIDAHVAALHAAGRTVMVQPYLSGVDARGETALIHIDGRFSHAICKGAMLAPGTAHDVHGHSLYLEENISPRVATEAELTVARAAMDVLAARFGRLLYARIDLLPGADGPVVVEVEITEPSLFLDQGPGSAQRLAAAIRDRVGLAA